MGDNPILDAVSQSWRISVIMTACRLGVFSRLDGGRMSAEELARDLHCAPRLLEALLDVGCGSGLYAITLCRHYPQLAATLIDRDRTPPCAADIAGWLAETGFTNVRRFALTERSTCFVGTG